MVTMNPDGTVAVQENTPTNPEDYENDYEEEEDTEETTQGEVITPTPEGNTPSGDENNNKPTKHVTINAPEKEQRPELRKQESEKFIFEDKIYAVNMLALQAEEFLQWLYHKFGETIPGLDDNGLKSKIRINISHYFMVIIFDLPNK